MRCALAVVILSQHALAAELCDDAGINDFDARPLNQTARPAAGLPFVDPNFGSRLIRITDGATDVTPLAPTLPSWNADESALLLAIAGGRYELRDGRTYALEATVDLIAASTGNVYWHTTDPDVLFTFDVTGRRLLRYRRSTRLAVAEEVARFPACDDVSATESFTSWDSSVFGVRCRRAGGYDLGVVRSGVPSGPVSAAASNQAEPSPAPSGALFHDGDVLDATLSTRRSLGISNPADSFSLGRDSTGGDVHYAVAFDGPLLGTVVARPFDGRPPRVLIGPSTGAPFPPSGTEISAIAHRRSGLVLASIVGQAPWGQRPLENELVMANGSSVCRLAHHRSTVRTHATLSPTGTRVVFASNWFGTGPLQTYVLERTSVDAPVETEGSTEAESAALGPLVLTVGCGCDSAGLLPLSVIALLLSRRRRGSQMRATQ